MGASISWTLGCTTFYIGTQSVFSRSGRPFYLSLTVPFRYILLFGTTYRKERWAQKVPNGRRIVRNEYTALT